MPVELKISIEPGGEKELTRMLHRVGDSFDQWDEFFTQFTTAFYTMEKAVFRSGGSAYGLTAWKPLSPKYKSWKEARYPGRPILTLRGHLGKALSGSHGSQYSKYRKTDDELTLGVKDIAYARAHQSGNPERNLPPRPPIRLSDSFVEQVTKDLQKIIVKRWKSIADEAGYL